MRGATQDHPRHSQTAQAEMEELATQLEHMHAELVAELRHELLTRLPRLQYFALQAVERPTERFAGEKNIARTILERDIPRQEVEIEAMLHFLEHAPGELLGPFLVADYSHQRELVLSVIREGGVIDRHRKWRAL